MDDGYLHLNMNDYSGHPFQVQLSRELAARGHQVDHTYCAQYVSGRGQLNVQPSDPAGLTITPFFTNAKLDKYHPTKRLRFELDYARVWRDFLRERSIDVAVACNVPLVSLARMQPYFRGSGQKWLLWHQDLYSKAVRREVHDRLRIVSKPVGAFVERLEISQVKHAGSVVAISDAFTAQYSNWALSTDHVSVIPNWAPLDEICPLPRDNCWSRANLRQTADIRLLYSGTLGRKHNPILLLDLLDGLVAQGVKANLVVCSEGVGAEDLRKSAQGRSDVQILGFQPAEDFAQVLSSGDVVVALLEPDASKFSVPSKVLSYLSAGRPIVGLMPDDNPAADDIRAAGGFVSSPTSDGTLEAVNWLAALSLDRSRIASLSTAARSYAEMKFDIRLIADQFLRSLKDAAD